jgi:hypothetical protein
MKTLTASMPSRGTTIHYYARIFWIWVIGYICGINADLHLYRIATCV